MTRSLWRPGAFAAAVVLVCAGSVAFSPTVHAGEPVDNRGFDGYPQPSEWDAVIEYLEKIGATEDVVVPAPASPVEVPAVPVIARDAAPDAPAIAPISDGVAAPTAVQLPNTGGGIERGVLPATAMMVAVVGTLLVGMGRSVGHGVRAT